MYPFYGIDAAVGIELNSALSKKKMENLNRRTSERIDIKLPCHVWSPALWMQRATNTENISRSGVLLAWRGVDGELPVPSPGQIVTVEIELPATNEFGQKCIHCQGTVVRITNSAENFPLFALRVNYMDFRLFPGRIQAFEGPAPAARSWMA